jgi:hypothetical protein
MMLAAAQSLPDFGILANSARLLRHRESTPPSPPAVDHPMDHVAAAAASPTA